MIDFMDEHGVRHRLYLVADKPDIRAIDRMMSDKSCIIADGHHRYTTGLTYWRESDNPAAAYQMMAFTNTRQKGLVVLATHRVVGGIEGLRSPQRFLLDLKSHGFDVIEVRIYAGRRGQRAGQTADVADAGDEEHCTTGT